MAEQVIIGSRLPNALILRHPKSEKTTVTIAGLNSSKIIGATHVTTEVDAAFWQAWKAAMPDYQPLKSGAIFEAGSEKIAKDKAKELASEKTGLEPMAKDAGGVKPSTSKD